MKKILFAIPIMNSAGTEQALLSMLGGMDLTQFETTVLLVSKSGVWTERIPKECEIMEIPISEKTRVEVLLGGTKVNIVNKIKKGNIVGAVRTFIRRKLFHDLTAEISVSWKKIAPLGESYDMAVCYMMHNPFVLRYVAEKITAKQKVVFMHNDFSITGYPIQYARKYLCNYDRFFGVSKQVAEEFASRIPEFSKKTEVFYNIVNTKSIIEKANQELDIYEDNFDGVKLLTVGRLNYQKGYDIAIEVMAKIKNSGFNVRWYVIGGGELSDSLTKQIQKNNLQNDFILLGVKGNSFAYIKQCDVYVQPSRHEGYCTTVNEARVLHKPIVATDVSGTREMIVDNETGFIVDIEINAIYNAIVRLIESSDLRKLFESNLSKIDFEDNTKLKEVLSQI